MSGTATALLSAAAGVVAGIVTTAWKSRKELESQYDIDLRKRRIDAYVELWKLLLCRAAGYAESACGGQRCACSAGVGSGERLGIITAIPGR
jgi:hypothetical protein